MKTVITDRSLCVFPISETATEQQIYDYIVALRDTGVKMVEMDFRTVIKMSELPDGVKYIYRVSDPTFAELADAFDFDYVLITLNKIMKPMRFNAPLIAELSPELHVTPQLIRLLESYSMGKLGMVRLRGAFPLMDIAAVADLVRTMRMTAALPVDFCPTNASKTALDTAIKLTMAGADSVTLCTGETNRFAGTEEFLFTLMSVFETLPKEFDIGALCRASVIHKLIFRTDGEDMIMRVMQILDRDIAGLINADTGERVPMRVTLRENRYLQKEFLTALDRMMREQEMPKELREEISAALERFDADIYKKDMLKKHPDKGLLN